MSGGYHIEMATLSNPVSPTFYAWVRDEAGNITDNFSKTVQVGQLWTQTSGILPNFSAFDDNETIGIAFSTSLSSNFSVPGILLRNLTDNSTVGGNWNLRTDNDSIIDFDNSSLITAGNPYQIEVPSFTDDENVYAAVNLRFNTISGDGSSANPYGLQSREDLSAMRIYSNKVFEVKTDIDLAGMDWEPLGRQQPFQGTLRGDNKTISNLYVNSPTAEYSGLFGKVENATIQDLQLENVSIQAACQPHTGGLVGSMRGSTIKNVHARNDNISGGAKTGGLIGSIDTGTSSTVERTSAEFGKVDSSCPDATGGSNVGGLIGAVYQSSTITESYADVEVLSNYASTGGLIGGITTAVIKVSESYALGPVVSSKQNTGGLIGHLGGQNIIENSFSSNGVISDNVSYLGGLIGVAHNTNTFNKSYYDKDRSGRTDTGKGIGRTTKQLIETLQANGKIDNENSYTNWDETIWDFGNACEYPRLRWQPYDPLAVTCVRFGGNNDNVTDNNSVHTYTDIQITFNRPVDNSTLDNNTVSLSPSVNIHAAIYDNSSRTYTLTPAGPLDNNTTYTLTLSSGIKDAEENFFVGESRSFYTLYNATVGNVGTVWNFTNALATGRSGPTQTQINSAYSSTNLAGAVTINTNTQGIQDWTVPTTGTYRVEVWGARGGRPNGVDDSFRGLGAKMVGDLIFNARDQLRIVVGQEGNISNNNSSNGGGAGGGGSFLWKSSDAQPLIVAGGGG